MSSDVCRIRRKVIRTFCAVLCTVVVRSSNMLTNVNSFEGELGSSTAGKGEYHGHW